MKKTPTNLFSRSKQVFLGLTVLISCNSLNAQSISNLNYRLEQDNIIISYKLDGEENQLFRIQVFSSHDDYKAPIADVTGDVGDNINSGIKEIIWNAKEELGYFRGTLQLEVRGFIMPPFLQFSNITTNTAFRRGKPANIKWSMNEKVDNLQFELQQGDKRISGLGTTGNQESLSWDIPKNIKPGKDFRIIAISVDKRAMSAKFRIKRKVPMILKLTPLLIGAGAATAVILTKEEDPGIQKITDPKRPTD